MDCSPPGSSVHGILQAKILEWVAIFFSRGSSQRRDRIRVSWIGRQILYCQATWEALMKPGVLHPWGRRESDMTEQLDNSSAVRFGLCLSLRPYRLSARSHTALQTHCPVFISYPLPFLPQWSASLGLVRLSSPSRFTLTHPSSTIGLSLHHTSLGKPSFPTRCSQSLGCSLQKHTSFLW